jgi:hypothetical protein
VIKAVFDAHGGPRSNKPSPSKTKKTSVEM